MNRRRFVQLTVELAAAAQLPVGVRGSDLVKLAPTGMWIPTVAQVAEWLEYYKLTVGQANQRFADIVQRLAADDDDPTELERAFWTAEYDFNAMQGERERVAREQGDGYAAGRDGMPRENPRFLKPSHPGFGWYNYWAIGDYDRRWKLGLPRLGRTLEEEYQLLREQHGTEYLLA